MRLLFACPMSLEFCMKTMNWKEVKACSPKARLPHTHPCFINDLLCSRKAKKLGDMLRFGGVQAFGVDMPKPRRRPLLEKSGAQPEPGISGSNDFCNCSPACVMLYTNLQNAFSDIFSAERALGEGQRTLQPPLLLSGGSAVTRTAVLPLCPSLSPSLGVWQTELGSWPPCLLAQDRV